MVLSSNPATDPKTSSSHVLSPHAPLPTTGIGPLAPSVILSESIRTEPHRYPGNPGHEDRNERRWCVAGRVHQIDRCLAFETGHFHFPLQSFLVVGYVAGCMQSRSVTTTDEYLCRPETGADWRAEIESFADEQGIDAAWFVGMGAVQDAEIWYYDQDDYEYSPVTFDEHLEVSACVGNVARLAGERFAHTHVVLGRADGETVSGHLNAGTVFAGELYLRAFEGTLVREHDEATKLDMWL